jgi:hypothetical protein
VMSPNIGVFLISAIVVLYMRSISAYESHAEKQIKERLAHLKYVADHTSLKKQDCSWSSFVRVQGEHYGNTGNQMISLTHGLWLARKLNSTLLLPKWMEDAVSHFNTTTLSTHHCFVPSTHHIPRYTQTHDIDAEESFFVHRVFNDKSKPFQSFLPPLSEAEVDELSEVFVNVYASLWSAPRPVITASAAWIVENYLAGFNYTTVHKRNLDGECGQIMNDMTKPSDFSPSELPMDSPEWKGDLRNHHPICEMQLDFVKRTMEMHGRAGSHLFVAFDGQGDVSSFRMHRAVFGNVMESHPEYRMIPMKYVDMLVAMLGGFFILNPRSTFSLQVFIIRACWRTPSVPTTIVNDFYFQKQPDVLAAEHRPLWVSFASLDKAVRRMVR